MKDREVLGTGCALAAVLPPLPKPTTWTCVRFADDLLERRCDEHSGGDPGELKLSNLILCQLPCRCLWLDVRPDRRTSWLVARASDWRFVRLRSAMTYALPPLNALRVRSRCDGGWPNDWMVAELGSGSAFQTSRV